MQTFKELIKAKFVYKFKNTSSGILSGPKRALFVKEQKHINENN
jgi:hypothetical protein